jgi:dTDP-4-amino-4,6-dideoxygalactose transaminase
VGPGCDHVYHQFVIRIVERDAAKSFLADRGIASAIHYPIPIHRSQAYASLAGEQDVAPCASALANEILSLPMFPAMTAEQVGRIGDALHEYAELVRDSPAVMSG